MSLKVLTSLLGGEDTEAECSRSPWSTSRCSSHGCQASCSFRRQRWHWSGKSSFSFSMLSHSAVYTERWYNPHTHSLTRPLQSLSSKSLWNWAWIHKFHTGKNGQTWTPIDQRVSAGIVEGHFLNLCSSPIIAIITLNYYCNLFTLIITLQYY